MQISMKQTVRVNQSTVSTCSKLKLKLSTIDLINAFVKANAEKMDNKTVIAVHLFFFIRTKFIRTLGFKSSKI